MVNEVRQLIQIEGINYIYSSMTNLGNWLIVCAPINSFDTNTTIYFWKNDAGSESYENDEEY